MRACCAFGASSAAIQSCGRRDARRHLAPRDVEGGVREDEVQLREPGGGESDLDEAPGELRARAARNADDDLFAGDFFRATAGSLHAGPTKDWTGVLSPLSVARRPCDSTA